MRPCSTVPRPCSTGMRPSLSLFAINPQSTRKLLCKFVSVIFISFNGISLIKLIPLYNVYSGCEFLEDPLIIFTTLLFLLLYFTISPFCISFFNRGNISNIINFIFKTSCKILIISSFTTLEEDEDEDEEEEEEIMFVDVVGEPSTTSLEYLCSFIIRIKEFVVKRFLPSITSVY